MTEFTPLTALLGGALIGLAAVLHMALEGRVAGVAGIAARVLPPAEPGVARRLAFLAGLVAAPLVLTRLFGVPMPFTLDAGTATLVAGGLAVGLGTVVGSGCTSGHGVCGLSLVSRRSIVAVAVFMAVAAATVHAVRHL